MSAVRISKITITPVAFADPPLLNSVGVHEPFALRAVVEIGTDAGLTGLGETCADEQHLDALRAAAAIIEGAGVYRTGDIYRRVRAVAAPGATIASGLIGSSAAADRVFSPFEVACLDIQGQAAGRPVADLLGGAVREEVPFCACLFYKWAAHPGASPDQRGQALDPDGIVAQARRMADTYGFTALKLKGGVFPPEQEAEAIRALRRAFPGHPLRLDPNAAWTPGTAMNVARDLDGVLEYLEDPAPGIDGMAQVARAAPVPLATNMCVVAFARLPRPSGPTRSRWSCLTTTTGAACAGPGCSPGSARPSGWGCPCIPTHTSASASPPWSTWPRPPRTSPTPVIRTGRGKPRTSWRVTRLPSAAARSASRTGPASVSNSTGKPWLSCTNST
jgi:glucarate dehydratase